MDKYLRESKGRDLPLGLLARWCVGEMTGLRACDHSSTRGGSVTCKVELAASDDGPAYSKLVAPDAHQAAKLIASAVDHRYGDRWRDVPVAGAQKQLSE